MNWHKTGLDNITDYRVIKTAAKDVYKVYELAEDGQSYKYMASVNADSKEHALKIYKKVYDANCYVAQLCTEMLSSRTLTPCKDEKRNTTEMTDEELRQTYNCA